MMCRKLFAGKVGARKITAGVNLARREAFLQMIARGFRTEMQGVAMETGGPSTGYNRAGACISLTTLAIEFFPRIAA